MATSLLKVHVVLGGITAVAGIVSASSLYGNSIPIPEVCIKSAPGPKAMVKLCNVGGGAMRIEKIDVLPSMQKGKNYTISVDFTDRHLQRTLQKNSGVVVLVVRPRTGAVDGKWEEEFRTAMEDKKVAMRVTYSYFNLPVWGCVMSNTKDVTLR
jgi:hypothetical protein